MGTLHQTVDLPLFTAIRPGAVTDLARELAAAHLSFERGLVLTGRGPTADIGRALAESLESAGMVVRVEECRAASFEEADRLKQECIEGFFPQVVVAVGGGSVIDVVKLAASEKRLPWISVPTAASNDGFCSPVVVLRADGGRRSVGGVMPLGVVADLDVLMSAPRRLRLAGVGDLLSNLTACEDWQHAARRDKALVNGIAHSFALGGVRQILGAEPTDIDDVAFLELVLRGLLLSGVAMEVCGTSRPCSGGEHLISHQLDRTGGGTGLHGEQVGVATLFCRALQGDPTELRAFAQAVGMVATPADLGLDRTAFLEAAREAHRTRPGRWTTLTELADDAPALEAAYDAAFG